LLRLSFSTGTLYHLPLRTTFALAREAGFEGVELVLGLEVIVRGAAYVRQLSKEHSLAVLSVHPPILPYPSHNKGAGILPRLISLAEQTDCTLVVLHPPKATTTEESEWTQFVHALREQRERGGVQVSVENAAIFRPSDTRYLLHDLARLRAFADRYDLPLTFDTAHAGASPYGLLEAYELVAGRVVNVHFSDCVRRHAFANWKWLQTFWQNHQIPGQGTLPLAEFMQALLKGGYGGILTVELSPLALQAWSLSRIRRGLARTVAAVRQLEAQASRSDC
jgi:sugar phosphate isomerase/epimerase